LDGESAHRKASAYTGQHSAEKRGQISMPRAGFEPMILEFEWPNTKRSLDLANTEIGICEYQTVRN